jgi:hypothetical protein
MQIWRELNTMLFRRKWWYKFFIMDARVCKRSKRPEGDVLVVDFARF